MLNIYNLNIGKKHFFKKAISLPLFSVLVACGGGDSESTESTSNKPVQVVTNNETTQNSQTNQNTQTNQNNQNNENTQSNTNNPISAVLDINATSNKVTEYATTGSSTGITLSATDAGDTISFSLSDNAGGRFSIDTNTGEISVANGELLESSNNASHSITAIALSSDGSSSDTTLNITVDGDNCAVKANQSSASQYTVSWDFDGSTDLTGYKVYYSTSATFDKDSAIGSFTQQGNANSISLDPANLNLTTCNTVYVAVAAIGDRPESALSEKLEIFVE